MFVYLINIVLISVYALVFCRGEQTKLKKSLYVGLCFYQCFTIAFMRSGIGTDYGWYYTGFREMAESGFSDMSYFDWEIGFIFLNKLLGLFTHNSAVFIGVAAAISLSGPFWLIWKYSRNPFMSVFLFLNTYLFYLNLNYVRQAIAMSIMCFAYGFLKDRKLLWYLLLCVVAATFHLPVIYLIPVYFITFIKLNPKTLPIYAGGLVIYFIVSGPVLKLLLQHFHQEYQDSQFIKYGIAWKYAVFPILLCVAVVVLAFYLDFKMSRDLNVLMHLMLMMGFWQIVMTKHALFERFSYYTMTFMIIAIPEMIYAFKDKLSENSKRVLEKKYGDDEEGLRCAESEAKQKHSKIITAISAGVIAMAFAYNMMGLVIPKKGVHGVLPYKTIYGVKMPDIDGWFKR
ncbi:MAG: EpsG family protein [Oscillospiraceae bacterium]|nr:EpsG family protein [Oscillospiraceae bacterium]